MIIHQYPPLASTPHVAAAPDEKDGWDQCPAPVVRNVYSSVYRSAALVWDLQVPAAAGVVDGWDQVRRDHLPHRRPVSQTITTADPIVPSVPAEALEGWSLHQGITWRAPRLRTDAASPCDLTAPVPLVVDGWEHSAALSIMRRQWSPARITADLRDLDLPVSGPAPDLAFVTDTGVPIANLLLQYQAVSGPIGEPPIDTTPPLVWWRSRAIATVPRIVSGTVVPVEAPTTVDSTVLAWQPSFPHRLTRAVSLAERHQTVSLDPVAPPPTVSPAHWTIVAPDRMTPRRLHPAHHLAFTIDPVPPSQMVFPAYWTVVAPDRLVRPWSPGPFLPGHTGPLYVPIPALATFAGPVYPDRLLRRRPLTLPASVGPREAQLHSPADFGVPVYPDRGGRRPPVRWMAGSPQAEAPLTPLGDYVPPVYMLRAPRPPVWRLPASSSPLEALGTIIIVPTLELIGTYTPVVTVTGTYAPTVFLVGTVE